MKRILLDIGAMLVESELKFLLAFAAIIAACIYSGV